MILVHVLEQQLACDGKIAAAAAAAAAAARGAVAERADDMVHT
jgi:hypothetical protein